MAESTVSIIQAIWLKKEVPIKRFLKLGIPFLFIGILMYFAVKMLESVLDKNVIGLFFEVDLGASVYCILSLVYFIKSQNDVVLSIIENLKRKYIR